MAIAIVEFPINSMVIFHSYVKLPEGEPILQNQSSAGWWLSPTPPKNMSSSVGMIIPNIWKNEIHFPNHQPAVFFESDLNGLYILIKQEIQCE